MTSGVARLTDTLSCHAWNKDGTQVALCPDSNEVHIYEVKEDDPKNWKKIHTLSKHLLLVTGVDWDHVVRFFVRIFGLFWDWSSSEKFLVGESPKLSHFGKPNSLFIFNHRISSGKFWFGPKLFRNADLI